MTGAVIKVDNAAVMGALRKLIEAVTDTAPAMKNIGEYASHAMIGRIQEGVTPEGQAFKPLNELYKTTKKGPGILRGESGDLARIIYQAGEDDVQIGSNAIYAAAQHFGATIKPKSAAALVFSMGNQVFKVKSVTIPARPFVGLSAADQEEILEIIKDYLIESSGGALER